MCNCWNKEEKPPSLPINRHQVREQNERVVSAIERKRERGAAAIAAMRDGN